jgi:hypothetical protein
MHEQNVGRSSFQEHGRTLCWPFGLLGYTAHARMPGLTDMLPGIVGKPSVAALCVHSLSHWLQRLFRSELSPWSDALSLHSMVIPIMTFKTTALRLTGSALTMNIEPGPQSSNSNLLKRDTSHDAMILTASHLG